MSREASSSEIVEKVWATLTAITAKEDWRLIEFVWSEGTEREERERERERKRDESSDAGEADAEDQFEGGGFRISDEASWHAEYKDSAYIFVGGIPFDLTEGDLLAVFAQYGEIVDVNLVRDKSTGKSKGFAFLAYEDQRSTILAVDNLNGAKILGRIVRVDHVSNYKRKRKKMKRKSNRGERLEVYVVRTNVVIAIEELHASFLMMSRLGTKDNARWDHDIYDLPKGNRKPLHNALEQKQQHRGEKQDSPSRSANKDDRPLRSEAKWVRETIAERPSMKENQDMMRSTLRGAN
uniref:RRM domain-containing protein n=1 Tax=Ananas comosus var. bracteatus TaxID=296719 RepID=A0A6V7QVP0_ANACO